MSSIALVDCNNFFVSCERVFNPELRNRPVVVLSSNDGCIIARSAEAKALKIEMGAPLFKWADFLRAHDVVVCSSNFALYGDLSGRVMATLARFNPEMEVYSVDEAFMQLPKGRDSTQHCRLIREKVWQRTGIPVSIGVAPSKTLAKIAARAAKRDAHLQGVCAPESFDFILDSLPVQEIWGIGKRLTTRLAKRGIFTAAQLAGLEDEAVKKMLSVVALRTVWELRGIPCLEVEDSENAKQSIMTSRSFGRPILSKNELSEAVATYVARAGEKLREQQSLACWLQLFLMGKEYNNRVAIHLPEPTSYTPTLLKHAMHCLDTIYQPGFAYKKAGILLGDLVSNTSYQPTLFGPKSPQEFAKEQKVMQLIDKAKEQFGHPVLQFAAEGTEKRWQTKRELRSSCFTTRWDELLTIQI